MFDSTIIRVKNGDLIWYPPGTDEGAQTIDFEEDLEQLRQLASQPGGGLCFAAPGTEVTLIESHFSAAEKKHINKALPFTLEEQLISNIEELHFSTELVGKTSLCAAVCSKQKMQQWQEQLALLPALSHWTPEPHLLPWQSGQWTVLLEDGYAIVRTGNCEGFSIEQALLPGMLQGALAEADPGPEVVVVYGQNQLENGKLLPEALREKMQWRDGGFRAAMLLVQDENVAINLLQGIFANRLPLGRWWQQWRLVAVAFLAAFGLQMAAEYASYLRLDRENLELRREIEGSYRRAFPKGVLVDAEKQVRRQLDALRGTAQSSGFINLMNAVGEILASNPGTGIASINYNDKGGEMRMNITAGDFEAVEAIRLALTQSGLEAVMESSNVQGDLVRARLRVGEGN